MSTKQIEKPVKAILVDARCHYVSATGRRCRALAAHDTSRSSGLSAFCLSHSQMEQQYVNTKSVAEELLGDMDNFSNAVALNDVLGRLFVLQAQNRIPIRNAMALAYTAQVILSTIQPLRDEVVRVEKRSSHNRLILDAIFRAFDRDESAETPDESEDEPDTDTSNDNVTAAVKILTG